MNFIDFCTVKFIAGKGGSGIISFLHEKFRPFGGPDGGDGGNGGSIYLTASKNVSSLEGLKHTRIIKAQNGENGRNKNQHGANGSDIYLTVPVNTWIIDRTNPSRVLKILISENKKYQIAKGGIGGFGNARFKTSTKQTPYSFDNGDFGEINDVVIELKLLAHIGLVGFPNVGKSSLLNSLANTNSIVGNYSFTTIIPVLGCLITNPQISIVDIPGLISGAQFGKGLGFGFLRHIEHCQVLLFILDGSLEFDVFNQYQELINIIKQYETNIMMKKQFILINKSDLLTIYQMRIMRKLFKANLIKKPISFISALTGRNMEVIEKISRHVELNYDYDSKWAKIMQTTFIKKANFSDICFKSFGDKVLLESEELAKIIDKTPPVTQDNRNRLQHVINKLQIEQFLKANQIAATKRIFIYDFEYLQNNPK